MGNCAALGFRLCSAEHWCVSHSNFSNEYVWLERSCIAAKETVSKLLVTNMSRKWGEKEYYVRESYYVKC